MRHTQMGRPTVHDLVIHHTTAACICWDDYFGSRVDLSSAGLKFIVQFLEQTTQCMKSIPMKLLRCTVLIKLAACRKFQSMWSCLRAAYELP
jgi:hypothetical protein